MMITRLETFGNDLVCCARVISATGAQRHFGGCNPYRNAAVRVMVPDAPGWGGAIAPAFLDAATWQVTKHD